MAGADYKRKVAALAGKSGADWKAALASLVGRDGADFRKAIADQAGMPASDWRRAAMQLSGKSSWQEALANIADWWDGGGGGEPEWLTDLQVPGDGDLPTHAASFLDEEYWDGEEATAGDLFTGITIVDAGGLSVDAVNGNDPHGSAGLMAALNAVPCVLYLQFTLAALPETESRHLIAILSAGQTAGVEVYMQADGDTARNLTITAYAGGYDNQTNFASVGEHKLALRFDGSDVTRASLNGSTITVAAAGETPFTVGEVYLGSNGSGLESSALDRSFTGNLFEIVAVYPDQNQSDMNAMTAL